MTLPVTRVIRLTAPLDLAGTLRPIQRGGGDPCMRLWAGECWRATRTVWIAIAPASTNQQEVPQRATDCTHVAKACQAAVLPTKILACSTPIRKAPAQRVAR